MATTVDAATLLQDLQLRRRDRLARNGGLGPIVKALHGMADLMDRDNIRTAAHNRRDGRPRHPVGIPPNMGLNLIRQVCTVPRAQFDIEWIRLVKEESLEAAIRWGDEQAEFARTVSAIVYPAGLVSPTITAAEVRTLADQYAADAEPVAIPPKIGSRLAWIPTPDRPRQASAGRGPRSTNTLHLPTSA